jgi:hypothetical protein
VSGGRQACDFLLSKDHQAAKAQTVGDAISAHLNLHLPVRKYGEVASLVAKGAVCDLFGFEKRKLPEKFKVTCCAPIQPVTCRPPCSQIRRWLPVSGLILAGNSLAHCPRVSGSTTSNRVPEHTAPHLRAIPVHHGVAGENVSSGHGLLVLASAAPEVAGLIGRVPGVKVLVSSKKEL